MQHLKIILEQLRNANLTVEPQKCQLGMVECIYLGHVVSRGIVRPEFSKVEAVQAFSQPITKKQVRAFLRITYRLLYEVYSPLFHFGSTTHRFNKEKQPNKSSLDIRL